MERQSFYNEIDMLKGNINRISVSRDMDDIIVNYNVALRRLVKVFEMRIEEFKERGY